MKKKLLFVLMLFVTLTGFKSKDIEVPACLDIAKQLRSSGYEIPKITGYSHKGGKVEGYEGQKIVFYIEFVSNPPAKILITKNGQPWKTSGEIAASGHKVEVTIENAKQEDSGMYEIILTNEYGQVKASFAVTIRPNPNSAVL